MGLTDYLGKKRRLMIVKEVEFGVYLGNKDDKVLLPEKTGAERCRSRRSGRSILIQRFLRPSDRNHTGTEDHAG